jgi:CubicO group peptidase (beta-lactamase class C family)
MVPVFSSTKGMTAFAVAGAVSRGVLDYQAPVAQYWPEFAAHGKESITVRQLLDHRAGLPVLDRVVRLSDMADRDRLAEILADQKPLWSPGTRQGYHPITAGLYQGELLRRVDPRHRTLGRIFAEDFAGPLALDFFIGLPEEQSLDRIATLASTSGLDVLRYERDVPLRIAIQMFLRRGLTYRALSSPRTGAPERATRREFLGVESPAAGGVGTARSLARVYGAVNCPSHRAFWTGWPPPTPSTTCPQTIWCCSPAAATIWGSANRVAASVSAATGARTAPPVTGARSGSPIPQRVWVSAM